MINRGTYVYIILWNFVGVLTLFEMDISNWLGVVDFCYASFLNWDLQLEI